MAQDKDILKSSIIQGFGTLIVREFFLKLLSFVGQIFLARLLIPSDFGTYVIIAFIINFISIFSDIGLSLAIIQKKEEPTQSELSGVFWLRLLFSSLLILLIWFFAPFVKMFYPSFLDANITMLRVFSVTLVLTSLRAIPVSLLERKIKYSLISLLDIIGVFVYYVVALFGALMHYGVWSFILAALTKEIIETIILYRVEPFIPSFSLSIKEIKKMIKYGVYIQGLGLATFFSGSINPVIGGRLSGVHAVGLLDFASNLVSIPAIIATNFGRVAFAGYSRIQEEKQLLLNSVERSISMLSIILYIFPVIIFSLGGELVPIIFSEKWTPAIPALYWFSAAVFFYPIIASFGQVILSIGRSKEIFQATLLTTIFGWIAAFLLVQKFGFIGIAISTFFIYLALFLFYILILKKNGYVFPIASIITSKLIVAALSLAIIIILNILLPHVVHVLIFKLIVGVATYVVLMFIFVRRDTFDFLKLISQWLHPKL